MKIIVFVLGSSEQIHSIVYVKQQLLWATSNNKVHLHESENMVSLLASFFLFFFFLYLKVINFRDH